MRQWPTNLESPAKKKIEIQSRDLGTAASQVQDTIARARATVKFNAKLRASFYRRVWISRAQVSPANVSTTFDAV